MPKGDGPHILIYDLENSPLRGWSWSERKIERLLKVDEDSHILTVAYKWRGSKKVYTLHGDERYIVEQLWKLFDAADILVAHNGDRFDQKKANTKFFKFKMGPPSPYQSVDTLKVANAVLGHHSHRLEALARLAETELKKSNRGIELWFDVMDGDRKALDEMLEYNVGDVVALEEIYDELLPWHKSHPNLGLWSKGEYVCPNCGSRNVQKRGTKFYRTRLSEFQLYYCNNCGAWPKERLPQKGEKVLLK